MLLPVLPNKDQVVVCFFFQPTNPTVITVMPTTTAMLVVRVLRRFLNSVYLAGKYLLGKNNRIMLLS
jgi:hypothetical protein